MEKLTPEQTTYITIRDALSNLGVLERDFTPPNSESLGCVTYSIKEIGANRILEENPDSTLLDIQCWGSDNSWSDATHDAHEVKKKLLELAGIDSDVFETSVLVDMKQPGFETKLAQLSLTASEYAATKAVADAKENLDQRVASTVQSVKDMIPLDQNGKIIAPGIAAKTIVDTIKGLQALAHDLEIDHAVDAGLSTTDRLDRHAAMGGR